MADKKTVSRKVLLIEDDEIDRQAIMRSLSRSSTPHECDHIGRISELGSSFGLNGYDIILTDMNLPDSSGLDTVASLLSVTTQTPIVVMSGIDDEIIALESVHAGAQDFLSKQYIGDTNLITRTISHAIERHQLKLGIEKNRKREHFLAHYDQCTTLPNRVLFLDRLQQSVTHGQREKESFAVCFLDLDRFKDINDSIGHAAGDEVLRCVSQRMKDILRESDTIARFGGDEFVIILQKTSEIAHLKNVTRKLIEAVNKPIPFGHHECSVGASIGIACYPKHAETSEQILKYADMAMYEAKRNGRNQMEIFSDRLLENINLEHNQENKLKEALKDPNAHFSLSYQPRVSLKDGSIHSVEALVRWHHPDKGQISADAFVPFAENLEVIETIDKWVIETACKQLIKWQEIDPTIRIGVNISGRSFNRDDFTTEVIECLLNKYNVDGKSFEIDVTEGILLKNTHKTYHQLMALKKLGVTIAIDDFGTGFSSLHHINQLPIDTLKIDGSFMCDINSPNSEKMVLKAIVALGKALELQVVAKCIETEEQKFYLQNLVCNEGQGFLWGKPEKNWMPAVPTVSETMKLNSNKQNLG